ncbi:hypothetical protein DL89DRAFT_267781 [Linderina pennispora]|uniref:Uncharacterized protein n=1 Tax=Linderina pennispora TaxID=61395 RepID=A0A1Y1W880_9FUNG|nr:uncharacterized protein DL89DRAFT_267781 [Linderina pennispora]ORX69595.1 hypothetical protein DL89DRAFT_267781 [Linderina pennispora]
MTKRTNFSGFLDAGTKNDPAVVPSQGSTPPSAQPNPDEAPVKYLRHLLETRLSISKNYMEVLPKAYNTLLVNRVKRDASDTLDEEVIVGSANRVVAHCNAFTGIVRNIDLVCNTLDETIVHFLSELPPTEEKRAAINENGEYFSHLLKINVGKFDPYQLAIDPEKYLDAFIPSFILDAPTPLLNWREFLIMYGSPLLRSFVMYDLHISCNWTTAKTKIVKAFGMQHSIETVGRVRYGMGQLYQVQDILHHVSKYGKSKRLLTLGVIAGVCTLNQQQMFVNAIEGRGKFRVGEFNFSELCGDYPHTKTGAASVPVAACTSAAVPSTTSVDPTPAPAPVPVPARAATPVPATMPTAATSSKHNPTYRAFVHPTGRPVGPKSPLLASATSTFAGWGPKATASVLSTAVQSSGSPLAPTSTTTATPVSGSAIPISNTGSGATATSSHAWVAPTSATSSTTVWFGIKPTTGASATSAAAPTQAPPTSTSDS